MLYIGIIRIRERFDQIVKRMEQRDSEQADDYSMPRKVRISFMEPCFFYSVYDGAEDKEKIKKCLNRP